MKRTAVEWLKYLYENQGEYVMDDQWKEALEMEKEQMIDFAYKYGNLTLRQIADAFDNEYKNEK